MAALSTQAINRSGHTPTYASAAGGGDTFTPGERVFVHVKNGDASPHSVTLVTQDSVDGLALADVTVAVAAGSEEMIGPLPARHFADPDTGLGSITYTAVTSVTIAVLELAG
jgi:hypothetical protein